ncbi:hypothetical protein AZI86_11365 [Bdellovibrio bacteriovorus]|uniref:Uncharacterized protein n=1 Tax=Bdellovibrio bacteriovorus TaxID=959 RepID=A0A150WLL3_BDEBC|nr:hypothetical protein [Bdellovibrio bacteriovorus]KYG64796.1 hypothetical protein AZI86_11365 [Bdellovibrio bacteriovorus]
MKLRLACLVLLLPLLNGCSGCSSFELLNTSSSSSGGNTTSPTPSTFVPEIDTLSLNYLKTIQDQYTSSTSSFYVFKDSLSPANHFNLGATYNGNGGSISYDDKSCTSTQSYTGDSCIKFTYSATGAIGDGGYAGWDLLNGAFPNGAGSPQINYGTIANAGWNLTGATSLTFWAKGQSGGEKVKFYALGAGYSVEANPDSNPEVHVIGADGSGFITLTTTWTQYTMDLSAANLSYVLRGFGAVTSSADLNSTNGVFYVDEIKFNGITNSQSLGFLQSYESPAYTNPDGYWRQSAYSYDNALALIAFVGAEEYVRAKKIADSFLYALSKDPTFTDGRVRNAYTAGDLKMAPGWENTGVSQAVQMPLIYDSGTGLVNSDSYSYGTATGNVAWALLGILSYYENYGKNQAGASNYLTAARSMADWIHNEMTDSRGAGGFKGGYAGFDGAQTTDDWKSVEHNLDIYAAFQRLCSITGVNTYCTDAAKAKTFILSMWNASSGCFWPGTGTDGVTTNTAAYALDVQAWSVLALKDSNYYQALNCADTKMKTSSGAYSFDDGNSLGHDWYEGTAQMLSANILVAKASEAQRISNVLKSVRRVDGAIVATQSTHFSTSFGNGYYNRAHVGATAWYLIAQMGINPFWHGHQP